jgi:hypothetical protein
VHEFAVELDIKSSTMNLRWVKFRQDKTSPNFSTTVEGVFAEVQEGITLQEISDVDAFQGKKCQSAYATPVSSATRVAEEVADVPISTKLCDEAPTSPSPSTPPPNSRHTTPAAGVVRVVPKAADANKAPHPTILTATEKATPVNWQTAFPVYKTSPACININPPMETACVTKGPGLHDRLIVHSNNSQHNKSKKRKKRTLSLPN